MANGFIGQVNIGTDQHLIGSTLFATSITDASTPVKEAVLQGSAVYTSSPTGITIHVKFAHGNTVTSGSTLKLKVGSEQTAYPITNPNGALTWHDDSIISFTFDGTSWVINSSGIDASSTALTLGNIQSNGALQTTDVQIANGDKLVITDASDSNKIARASLAFTDAVSSQTQNTTFLRSDGTWAAPSYTSITAATDNALGGFKTGYSESGNNYAVKLSSEKAYVTVPWTDTKYKLVTAATNAATNNGAGTNGSTFLNLVEGTSVLNSHKLTGTNITITSNASTGEISFEGKPGTVTSVQVQGTSPIVSSVNTAQTGTLNTTISLVDAAAHYVLAGPASGSATAAPEFRVLVTDDIPNTIARLASPTFTGTPLITTTPNSGDNSHAIADTAFVIAEINARLASNDAMLFKGTIGTGGNPGTLPTTGYEAGWTYRVITAGTYAGQECEVGDLLIAITDYAAATASAADWTVAQTNIDGSIYMGNNTFASGQTIIADGTNGKVKTSGYTIAAPSETGQILYASSASAYNTLTIGNSNEVLTVSNGVPVWTAAQHYITHLYVTTSSGTANTSSAINTNGNVYLRLFDDTTVREIHKISGTGGTTVTADANANIIITSKKYKTAGTANAFTGLSLTYNNGSDQTTAVSVNTAEQIGYVNGGILYIKSIKYSTTSVSTGVSEDNT